MALPNKVISLATKTRNRWGPRADRVTCLLAMAETSGTTAANDGLAETYQSDQQDLGTWNHAGSPTFTPSGAYAPYLSFDGATDYLMSSGIAGASTDSESGTMVIVFKADTAADGSHHTLFHSGQMGAEDGRLWIRRMKNTDGANPDGLTLSVRVAGGNKLLLFTLAEVGVWTDWHVLVVTWGSRGFTAYLDTLANKQSDASATGPVEWQLSRVFRLANHTGSTYFACSISAFCVWDIQLSEDEILRVLTDPWICSRPAPAEADVFATFAGPAAFRPTETGITLALTTGHSTLITANVNWRVKYGTDPMNLSSTATAAGQLAAATDTMSPIVLTGLTASTRYYYRAEWTTDGSTWYPMPVGLCEFWTKRADATLFPFACMSDTHTNADGEGGVPAPLTEGFGVELFLGSAKSRKHYANWRAMRDIITNTQPEFLIWLGDDAYPGPHMDTVPHKNDIDTEKMLAYAAFRNFYAHLFARCASFFVLGNHETEAHYRQNAKTGTDVAAQKQSTIARKRYLLNPIPATNAETLIFGENEGDPATDAVSWIPPDMEPFSSYAGGLAGYVSDYVVSAENKSPLGNYAAFSWGGEGNRLLVALCDVTRYPAATGDTTAAGDPNVGIGTGGAAKRATGELASFGTVQFAKLQTLLETVDADHKIVCIHNLPGGEGISVNSDDGKEYFRGSGAIMTDAERAPLLAMLKSVGVRAVHKGHDHRFCHVVNGGVSFITSPTPGAPSHTGADGWADYGEFNASYGTPQDRGSSAHRVRKAFNIVGYLRMDVGGGDYRVSLRETEIPRAGGGGAVLSETTRPEVSRFLAPGPAVPVSDAVTVSEAPVDVAAVYKRADILADPTWYDTPPIDYKGDAVGPYPFDEDRSDGAIDLDPMSDVVMVQHVPRTVYEVSLLPRRPARSPGSGPYQASRRRGGRR